MIDTDQRAYVFTFPFFMLVNMKNKPELRMVELDDARLRIYPPFRSAPANWTVTPVLMASKIPFLTGREPKNKDFSFRSLWNVAAYPGTEGNSKIAGDNMTLVWKDSWNHEKFSDIFPMDSIRVDMIPRGKAVNAYLIEEFISRLVENVRCVTKQWWIGRSSDTFTGWKKASFEIDKYGKMLGQVGAYGSGSSVSGIEKPLDKSKWNEVLSRCENGIDPDISDYLLLDASYFFAKNDMRRFVMDAATTCEIEKDNAFERLWKRYKNTNFRKGKAMSGWDLGRHLDSDLENLCGRSLKKECPEIFMLIENLWDARGNVAHGEGAKFKRDGSAVEISNKNGKVIMSAARECVEWLRNL